MKKERLLSLLLILMVSITVFAQNTLYSGRVFDESGEPIIGASVVVKGTSQGSVSDMDGKFSFEGTEGATLVISYIGYCSQELRGTKNMVITLKEDSKVLTDVVVIGYGVQKKSVVTASIAKVGADELGIAAPVRMDNALKG